MLLLLLLLLLACVPSGEEVFDTGDAVADVPEGAIVAGDIWCLPPSESEVAAIDPASLPQGPDPCMAAALYRVDSTTDGDTFTVQGVDSGDWYTVRIIGVDTPETWGGTECYGPEAKQFTYAALHDRTIWLTHDYDCTDNYDRLLAYVHLSDDFDCFLERLLLRGGYAETMTFSDTSTYAETFRHDEDWARDQQMGQWGECY